MFIDRDEKCMFSELSQNQSIQFNTSNILPRNGHNSSQHRTALHHSHIDSEKDMYKLMNLYGNVLGISEELKRNILSQYKPDEKLDSFIDVRLRELNQKYDSNVVTLKKRYKNVLMRNSRRYNMSC